MERKDIQRRYFPQGIPRLWCPLISHYRRSGEFDSDRMKAHVVSISPCVNSFLAPGSTGDGWEMDSSERMELVDLLHGVVETVNGKLLVGMLETEQGAAATQVSKLASRYFSGGKGCICGAVVTAPKGKDLDQETIYHELAAVLETGTDIALYQLPQITENEIAPKTAVRLAEEYPNFYLLKDTSGRDAIAAAGGLPDDLFLVRGAEGDYLKWYRSGGGPYDGFLLSTANGFAPQLKEIIDLSDAAISSGIGQETPEQKRAEELSEKLSHVVARCFELSSGLSFGNPFANANKAVDHWMAFGPGAAAQTPPLTHSKNILPHELIEGIGDILRDAEMLPLHGYLG